MSREGAQGWGPAAGQAVGPGCVPGRGRVWVGWVRAAGVGSAAPGRRGRDGPGRRAQSVLARTWREARPGWGLPTGAESLDALFVRPPVTLGSSRRGRAGGRSCRAELPLPFPGPRGSLSLGAEEAGGAAVQGSGFSAPELSSRNFPAPRPVGEAAAVALPTLPAPRAGIWRRNLPLLAGARAGAPAPRLLWPRKREKRLPLAGAACLSALLLPTVGRRRQLMGRDVSASKIDLFWRVCQLFVENRRRCKLTGPN